jgi:DUF2075 family protein
LESETANPILYKDEYDFQVFNNPSELRAVIEEKNAENNKSRMVAGYCWDWISKKNVHAYDIEFSEFDFKMQWNLTKDGSSWLIAEDSINEIGCIHTCQGLELDYVGVIVGNDLRYENGEVITDVLQRSSMDRSVFGIKKMLKEDSLKAERIADQIIRNTYRTLTAIPYLEILLENLEFSRVSAVKNSRISQENDLIATENPGFKSF